MPTTRTDRNQVFDRDGNLLSEEIVEVEIPDDPQEMLRDAIGKANNIAELKRALLGEDGSPGAEARRDGRGIT